MGVRENRLSCSAAVFRNAHIGSFNPERALNRWKLSKVTYIHWEVVKSKKIQSRVDVLRVSSVNLVQLNWLADVICIGRWSEPGKTVTGVQSWWLIHGYLIHSAIVWLFLCVHCCCWWYSERGRARTDDRWSFIEVHAYTCMYIYIRDGIYYMLFICVVYGRVE